MEETGRASAQSTDAPLPTAWSKTLYFPQQANLNLKGVALSCQIIAEAWFVRPPLS